MINISTDPIFQLPEMLEIRATLHNLYSQVQKCAQSYHSYKGGDLKVSARLDVAYNAALAGFNCTERSMWNRYRQLKAEGVAGRVIEPIPFL